METVDGGGLTSEQASEMAGDIAHDSISGSGAVHLSGIEQDEFYNYVRSMTKIYAKKVGRYIKSYTEKKYA